MSQVRVVNSHTACHDLARLVAISPDLRVTKCHRRRSVGNQRNEFCTVTKMKTNKWTTLLPVIAAFSGALNMLQADEHAPVGYTDTPMLPGGKWHVHDQ